MSAIFINVYYYFLDVSLYSLTFFPCVTVDPRNDYILVTFDFELSP